MVEIILSVACVLLAIGGFFLGVYMRKRVAEKAIKSAEQEAERIIEQSKSDGETKKKELLLSAKEDILKFRNEAEREIKERRADLTKIEKSTLQKEENLDKKMDQLAKKEEQLAKQSKELDTAKENVEKIRTEQVELLQKISGYTSEQAKQVILEKAESEARHDMAMKLVALEQEFKETADEKARNIISLAIQRCASDSVAEMTVSVVDLPNDEMKGRIIGREGRNIRAIETLTGVDLIIDDTSEAITVSTFDPVRREVARLALEKLIADGRIHPSRIEEMVEKSRKEVDAVIKKEGEQATFETGIHGLNPELIKILGRLKFRTSYGQNVLKHSIEVSHIAGMMAKELGIDSYLAKRAGLLHDIGKAINHEVDGSHVQLGVELAKKYKENKEVVHAIEAHHGDVEPHSVIAMIVQAADAISAARPGARKESLENYVKRLESLEEIANSFAGVERSYAIQAGREVRIIVKPEDIDDAGTALVARDIVKKIEQDLDYPGQIKVNVIRETRSIDYAK